MTQHRSNGEARGGLPGFADARMAVALVQARQRTQSKARSGTPQTVLAASRARAYAPRNGQR